ncbi:undecaprenyldiphospho-muramoylpentapeptide beta-N-acetylglucosaminyltransferase [Aliidiomarina shirensis]|uniref:UDP-N-acetylglucosamine--N-acetylmuramyl-(pentapeptide) pyrophosphoryl-undecaprenol N-acetylglucosamine transferase n=1 Tax=Aliidiomarina shirensis TaxID=1048642 RepID=A0A432WUV0_9GAMM|nr:undecaprenyldiphospho-muramoylpentapeptide beta-N-acetylglucosaminyltransferase [Aliidiomarina shirensis]RUO37543.1 undecaprenyldiphospho-muramoylpentapeptide beta-N-acetylglucosaminyltransferase [Aliidiomarina shirensis]
MSHVLISAGGTGGHVFPALAVAKALAAKGHNITWLGTKDRMESDVVPAHGFRFIGMQQQGLRGKSKLSLLAAPFRLCKSIWACRKLLVKEKPALVLGFGGYTAGPAGVAAWSKGIPLVIHEQNAIPGLTNRLLERFATRTLLGFSGAQKYLAKAEVVGNPVRSEIAALHAEPVKQMGAELQVLVVGGSLGAAYLNKLVPEALSHLQSAQHGRTLSVHHQVGKGNVAEVQQAYGTTAENNAVKVEVAEFISDMAAAYAWADIVICRAGALTVAELCAAGKPAILVPYPHAVDDHQTENAKALSSTGAGVLVQQTDLTEAWLINQLEKLLANPEQLEVMQLAAKNSANIDAVERIVAVCEAFLEPLNTANVVEAKETEPKDL